MTDKPNTTERLLEDFHADIVAAIHERLEWEILKADGWLPDEENAEDS